MAYFGNLRISFAVILPFCNRLGVAQVDAYRSCMQYSGTNLDFAIQECDLAINSGGLTDEQLVGALNNRGLLYENKNDFDRAVQDFTKAIGLNPRNPKPFNNRGEAYCNKREYDRASKELSSV